MDQPKISIIIPVYNGQEYLSDTLNCILSQSFSQFELIVVDDGSLDGTPTILADFAQRDSRIRVITISNSGVSVARNTGLDAARGRYIYMSDSDDLLHPQALEFMYKAITSLSVDMVMFPYSSFDNIKKPHFSDVVKEPEIIKDKDLFEVGVKKGLATSVYTKLFDSKISLWSKIRFKAGMTYGEDMFFCWKFCLSARNAAFIDTPLYFYRLYPGQATSRYHPGLHQTYQQAFNDIEQWVIQNHLYSPEFKDSVLRNYAKRIPAIMRMIVRSNSNFRIKITNVKNLQKDVRIQKYFSRDKVTVGGYKQSSAISWLLIAYKKEMYSSLTNLIRNILRFIKL